MKKLIWSVFFLFFAMNTAVSAGTILWLNASLYSYAGVNYSLYSDAALTRAIIRRDGAGVDLTTSISSVGRNGIGSISRSKSGQVVIKNPTIQDAYLVYNSYAGGMPFFSIFLGDVVLGNPIDIQYSLSSSGGSRNVSADAFIQKNYRCGIRIYDCSEIDRASDGRNSGNIVVQLSPGQEYAIGYGTTNSIFVSVTPPPVPIPASIWLLLSALTGTLLLSRKKAAQTTITTNSPHANYSTP